MKVEVIYEVSMEYDCGTQLLITNDVIAPMFANE